MFKLLYLGHAGFLLETDKTLLLMDPWLVRPTAFNGRWRKFPEPVGSVYARLRSTKGKYFFVSHAHSDHYDRDFLATLDRDTWTALVPVYPTDEFASGLRDLEFQHYLFMGDGQTEAIGDIQVKMLLQRPYSAEHSSLFVTADEGCLLHMNDTTISESRLKELRSPELPVIYAGQYSAVSPYPQIAMDLGAADKAPIAKRTLDWAVERFYSDMNAIGADLGIPCAGPAVVLGNETVIANTKAMVAQSQGPFDTQYLAATLQQHIKPGAVSLFEPFSELSIENRKLTYPIYRHKSAYERLEVLQGLIETHPQPCKIEPTPDQESLGRAMGQFAENIEKAAPDIISNLKLTFIVSMANRPVFAAIHFDVGIGPYLIDERPVDVLHEIKLEHPVYYEIHADLSAWIDFCERRCEFEEYWYGHHFRIRQSVTGYSPLLLNVLCAYHNEHLLSVLNAEFKESSNRTMRIRHCDVDYVLRRHCPHRGTDLVNCVPDESGIIVCPAHGWQFRVADGRCIRGDSNATINLNGA